jgi:hypothetical protein
MKIVAYLQPSRNERIKDSKELKIVSQFIGLVIYRRRHEKSVKQRA